MNYNLELESKRLLLRRFQNEDLDDFFEYAQIDEIGYNCGWEPIKDKNKALEHLIKMINADYDYLAVVLKSENKVIGSVSLSIPDKDRYNTLINNNSRELGFALSKYYWGKGYMLEAVKSILKYGFEDLKLLDIYSLTSNTNISSIELQEKCGFKVFGEPVKVRWIDGSIIDMTERKISKEDYFK